jgi:Raf kinase inhibitor-like YbhB/YbcL family protein
MLSACTGAVPVAGAKPGPVQAAPPTSTYPQSTWDTSQRVEGTSPDASTFVLSSPEVSEGGMLPREYTCDGSSATLPLKWSSVPAGTKSLALVMHTVPAPNESHWYWVLYNIPPDIQSLAKNISGIGALGNNSVNGKTAYSPPCSKGPGPKKYTFTIYALSEPPQFNVSAAKVSRDVLLAAIKDRTIEYAELNVYYSR